MISRINKAVFLLTLVLLGGCGQNNTKVITITNTLDQERKELVSIPYVASRTKFGVDSIFRVVDAGDGTEIPYQLERLGMDAPANILIYILVSARSTRSIRLENGAPASVKPRTFARYVPERYDDFAWENDVVAFRMYGKALEGRPDDAQGLDLWSKRTTDLVVDKWYVRGDYHTDRGEGMDFYAVGQTLGAGDVAPFIADTIAYPMHYRQYEVLDNGPLRTTFRLDYEPEQVGGQAVSVSKQYQLDVGSQLNKVVVTYTVDGEIPIAIGLTRREQPGQLDKQKTEGVLGYWEPEIEGKGVNGVGIVLADTGFESFEDLSKQYLGTLTAKNGTPITYYNGGAWSKAETITSAEQWFAYLTAFKARLLSPLIVDIE